jgi:hypothetical protein
VGTGIHGAEAKALHGAPAKRLYHKPVKKTDEEHGGTDFHPDVQRELQFLQQRESKVMKIAWIVCGVLLVAAGAFAFAAKTKRDRTIAAAEAYQKRIDDFAAEMQGKEIESEAGAKAAIAHAEAHANIGWESDLKAGAAVGSVISKAKSRLAKIEDEKEQTVRLATVEGVLRDPGSTTADGLFKARRTIESLENKLNTGLGGNFDVRVKAARATIDQAILKRLFEEASAAAAAASGGPEKMRAALNAYTRAEDEATSLLDRVMRQKDQDTKEYYTNEFKKIVEESNAFMERVFTPEVIERTPWTDLLAEGQKDNWQNYGLTGFRLERGVLEVAGPAAGSTANGLIAVPAAGGYRDFVIDMEFTLNKGIVDWLFRLGRRVDNTVEYYPVSTNGENALKVGVSYRMEAKFIGGKLNVALTPADSTELTTESGWTKSRKGAFGGQIHESVELKITRLKIRELRNS